MLQDRNKPWGIIVRKMDFPSGASNEEARRLIQAAQQSGVVRPVSAPLLIFKVFPDGREELVRGLSFRGFGLRSLRDIVAVSEENIHTRLPEQRSAFCTSERRRLCGSRLGDRTFAALR